MLDVRHVAVDEIEHGLETSGPVQARKATAAAGDDDYDERRKEQGKGQEWSRHSDYCRGSGNIAPVAVAGGRRRGQTGAEEAVCDAAGVVEAADAADGIGPEGRLWGGSLGLGGLGESSWLHGLGRVCSD